MRANKDADMGLPVCNAAHETISVNPLCDAQAVIGYVSILYYTLTSKKCHR